MPKAKPRVEAARQSPMVHPDLRLADISRLSPRFEAKGPPQPCPVIQRQIATLDGRVAQGDATDAPSTGSRGHNQRPASADEIPRRPDRPGLPYRLKTYWESRSGLSMGDVRVHRNSLEPARLQALAYTRGTEIYLGPGQERHLAHETYHVVQQKQGRVRPTRMIRGKAINDDTALELEADRHASFTSSSFSEHAGRSAGHHLQPPTMRPAQSAAYAPIQRKIKLDGKTFHINKNNEGYYEKDSMKDRREFWGNLQRTLPRLGFKATGSKAFNKEIETMLSDDHQHDFSMHGNKGYRQLILDLHENKQLLNKKQGWTYHFGPKSLGIRPTFTSKVQKDIAIKKGQHRRHIISSSTLGRAVEDGGKDHKALKEFLKRHEDKAIALGLKPKTGSITQARRSVWELLHNHKGNLWAGDGGQNTAAGFVRGHIMKGSNDVLAEMDEKRQGAIPHPDMNNALWNKLLPAHSKNKKGTYSEVWNSVASTLKAAYSDKAKQNKEITKKDIQDIRDEYIANADFDLPPHSLNDGGFTKLSGIYKQLIAGDPSIFAKNGALDKFLAFENALPSEHTPKTDASKQKQKGSSSKAEESSGEDEQELISSSDDDEEKPEAFDSSDGEEQESSSPSNKEKAKISDLSEQEEQEDSSSSDTEVAEASSSPGKAEADISDPSPKKDKEKDASFLPEKDINKSNPPSRQDFDEENIVEKNEEDDYAQMTGNNPIYKYGNKKLSRTENLGIKQAPNFIHRKHKKEARPRTTNNSKKTERGQAQQKENKRNEKFL